jgi:hypothetical protein
MRKAFAELPVNSAILAGGLCPIDQGVARTSGALAPNPHAVRTLVVYRTDIFVDKWII